MQETHDILVRSETQADWPAVDRINRAAFGGENEVEVVARLRDAGLVAVSLVAIREETVVGHVMLSWLSTVIGARNVRAIALAPMAVLPAFQRQGVGAALVRAAIASARRCNVEAIVVLGHPDYYPRFGFSAAMAARLTAPFSGPAFMALELVPGALDGTTVTYPPAFDLDR